jgi:hypothetical protein
MSISIVLVPISIAAYLLFIQDSSTIFRKLMGYLSDSTPYPLLERGGYQEHSPLFVRGEYQEHSPLFVRGG